MRIHAIILLKKVLSYTFQAIWRFHMSFIQKMIRAIGAIFGFGAKSSDKTTDDSQKISGFHGTLNAPALLLHEDNHFVLSVEYDFTGIPSWIEAYEGEEKLHIVQTTGDIASLTLSLASDRHNLKNALQQATHIALVSGTAPERILHHLSFTYHKNS